MIDAVTPIDGRYAGKTKPLAAYFSEHALIKYRLMVEVEYFIFLCNKSLKPLEPLTKQDTEAMRSIYENFTVDHSKRVKAIEKVTNHDVKAVEYFLKEQLDQIGLTGSKEFIHFGLTSQDINNTAVPISVMYALREVYIPLLKNIKAALDQRSAEWLSIPMLARTHGQSASPTGLGKEIYVFSERLSRQISLLESYQHIGKFGGATGNFNAHFAAYPDIDWPRWADDFLQNSLGIERYQTTTQIEHYDGFAELLQITIRISNILIDFCRDIWTYISMDYFKQKTVAGEIGSSAMPHKVNPIDFENAEGNLGMANAIANHLAQKLPISRLQRDLTDSTVLRNIGLPFAYQLIALQSIEKGMNKLLVNEDKIKSDLEANWVVIAEAIQNILRRESYPQPYEALKKLTRGKSINKESMHEFIEELDISDDIKNELKSLHPLTYTGNALSIKL